MSSTFPSVPVYVEVSPSDLLKGFFKIEGTLSVTDGAVVVAYHTRSIKAQPSSTQTLHLPLDSLQEVTLKGRLNVRIILRPRRLTALRQVPWAVREELILKVQRGHRKQAASLITQLQQELSTLHGDDLGSIPFQLPDTNLGLTEIKGLVYLDEEFLVFEVSTGLSGGSSSQKQIIKIEPDALETVRLDRGQRHDHLHIVPKKRDLLTAMPGSYEEALMLKIKNQYREAAEQLLEAITHRRATS